MTVEWIIIVLLCGVIVGQIRSGIVADRQFEELVKTANQMLDALAQYKADLEVSRALVKYWQQHAAAQSA